MSPSPLDSAAVWHVRAGRLRLRFSGPDRAKTLHNLTTADIKRLQPGHAGEAFVTSPQGKTLAFATIVNLDDSLLLLADEAAGPLLIPHLQKYGGLDDTTFEDVTADTAEVHVAGPRAEDLLRTIGLELPLEGDLAAARSQWLDFRCTVLRESPLGVPGVTLIGPASANVPRELGLRLATVGGAEPLSESAFDSLRIAAGTPVFGRDLTEKNLPQEVGRDDRAISFVKGCYLGQETVARLDALGHVNKILRGLSFDGDGPPPPGTVLRSGDHDAGWVTSSALSFRDGRPIGLGYVKTAFQAPGTKLEGAVDSAGALSCEVRPLAGVE